MTVAFSFLVEPDDDSAPGILDKLLCHFHLFAAVTLDAVENMTGDAVGMDPAQYILFVRHLTHDQGDHFLLPIVVQDLVERAEAGSKGTFCQADDHEDFLFQDEVSNRPTIKLAAFIRMLVIQINFTGMDLLLITHIMPPSYATANISEAMMIAVGDIPWMFTT